jgi:hypothetical protein
MSSLQKEQFVAIRVPSESRGSFAVHHSIYVAIADEVMVVISCCWPQQAWTLEILLYSQRVADSCDCWAKTNKSVTRAKHSSHVASRDQCSAVLALDDLEGCIGKISLQTPQQDFSASWNSHSNTLY